MNDPILFVSGLGRCGTTLIMTMLDAGGFPVVGNRPAYEPTDRWRPGRIQDTQWLFEKGGHAVKYLDPTTYPINPATTPPAVTILLSRNTRQQARSQIKMITGHFDRKTAMEGAMKRSIEKDMPKARAALGKLGPVYNLDFESILDRPEWVSLYLHDILHQHFPEARFNQAKAARVVMQRTPDCLPDLNMERHLLPLLAETLDG